jgi:hypothetical protein
MLGHSTITVMVWHVHVIRCSQLTLSHDYHSVGIILNTLLLLYLGDACEPTGLKGAGTTTNKIMQPEDYRKIEEDLQNQLHAKKHQRMGSGHHRVESWNFSFDSSNAVETSSHFSSGTEYDR